jgi:hypothetical protein
VLRQLQLLPLTVLHALRYEGKSLRKTLHDVCIKAICYLNGAVHEGLWVVGL